MTSSTKVSVGAVTCATSVGSWLGSRRIGVYLHVAAKCRLQMAETRSVEARVCGQPSLPVHHT